jgi:carbonic anhydrase/SulP family sulfate permease
MFVSFQLARPEMFIRAWQGGLYQFAPFMITLFAILFTDLLPGILIGLGVSVAFILHSNLRRPLTRTIEKHIGGELFVIELANQVSFLNRAVLDHTLQTAPRGTSILIDATNSEYIDPDIINMIKEFKDLTAPKHGVTVSLKGFRDKYQIEDEINYVDYSTRELQSQLTPTQVLQLLQEGNQRFLSGKRLSRDLGRQITATSAGQHPLAIVLSCIDSRTPTELILDLGLGDIFNIRVAGNVVGPKVLASIEYGTAVAGAKLILVMGHTRCGAINASVQLMQSPDVAAATGCEHLDAIVDRVRECINAREWESHQHEDGEAKQAYADKVARMNVIRHVDLIVKSSKTVRRLVDEGKVAVVGAMYDISTGKMEFLEEAQIGLSPSDKGEVAVS